MMKNPWMIIVIVAVLVGAAAFFGGMQYQKSQRNNQFFQTGTGPRLNRFGGNGQNPPVRGQIISTDSNGITVKLQDGSSKIVIIPDNANIMEATSAAKQSLTTGKNVMIFGTTNSDGSVTAQNVQLNPMGFGGGRGGNPNNQ